MAKERGGNGNLRRHFLIQLGALAFYAGTKLIDLLAAPPSCPVPLAAPAGAVQGTLAPVNMMVSAGGVPIGHLLDVVVIIGLLGFAGYLFCHRGDFLD